MIDRFDPCGVVSVSLAVETLGRPAAPGAEVSFTLGPQLIQQQAAGQLVQRMAAAAHDLHEGHFLQGGVTPLGFICGQFQQCSQEGRIEPVRDRGGAHGFGEFGGQDGQEAADRVGDDLLAVGQGGQVVHRTPPQFRKLLNIGAMALGSPRQEWQNAATTSRLAVAPTAATYDIHS